MLLSLVTNKFLYKDEVCELIPLGLYSKMADASGQAHLYMSEPITRFTTGLDWILDYVHNLCLHICKELKEPETEVVNFKYRLKENP